MDRKVYEFPTQSDSRINIELTYCNLLNKYRYGDKLDPEELDWMDTANTWLEEG